MLKKIAKFKITEVENYRMGPKNLDFFENNLSNKIKRKLKAL
jgi:hypothetical protein